MISQQFLYKFNVPAEWKVPCNVRVDNGSGADGGLIATAKIVLPIQISSGPNLSTEWYILPQLASPMDALLSWKWGIGFKLLLDCEKNEIFLKENPPAAYLASPDFHRLLPRTPSVVLPAVLPVEGSSHSSLQA